MFEIRYEFLFSPDLIIVFIEILDRKSIVKFKSVCFPNGRTKHQLRRNSDIMTDRLKMKLNSIKLKSISFDGGNDSLITNSKY